MREIYFAVASPDSGMFGLPFFITWRLKPEDADDYREITIGFFFLMLVIELD